MPQVKSLSVKCHEFWSQKVSFGPPMSPYVHKDAQSLGKSRTTLRSVGEEKINFSEGRKAVAAKK